MPSMGERFSALDRTDLQQRLAVAMRTLMAIAGGYAVTALATASLAVALPMPRSQSVLAATMGTFALFCAVVIWVFAAASVRRAGLGVLVLAAAPAAHLLIRWILS